MSERIDGTILNKSAWIGSDSYRIGLCARPQNSQFSAAFYASKPGEQSDISGVFTHLKCLPSKLSSPERMHMVIIVR